MRTLSLRTAAAVVAVTLLAACGGSSSSDVQGATFTVHAKDTLKFDKSSYTATAGDLNIGYANDGSLAHTLLIDGQQGFKLQVDKSTKSTSGKVNLPPGTYTLYCDIAGHRESGMQAKLTVT
jgi:plastocyanin